MDSRTEPLGTEMEESVIDLLVAAGYFRARIKGLSTFDKVVGGMTWAITACNIDVNVDLLFRENLSIGKKIALTETIVKALVEMKCPCIIEPHQIQGLDMEHILPVVQWLVKLAIDTKESAEGIEQMALWNYNSTLGKSENFQARGQDGGLSKIKEKFDWQRYYKRKAELELKDKYRAVAYTLLEYEGYLKSSSRALGTDGRRTGSQSEPSVADEGFEGINEKTHEISPDTLAHLVTSKEVEEAATNLSRQVYCVNTNCYIEFDSASEINSYGEMDIKAKCALLKGDIEMTEGEQAKLEMELSKTRTAVKVIAGDVEQTKKERQELLQALDESAKIEESAPEEIVSRLTHLLEEHEGAKIKEKEYKEKCRRELGVLHQRLEERVRGLEGAHQQPTPEMMDRQRKAEENVSALRIELATKNREIAKLERVIDNIPSRAELHQYQRRFMELHGQVQAKHKETKQYFAMYNALVDIRAYMEKEVNLLDSISDALEESEGNQGQLLNLISRLREILEVVGQAKQQLQNREQEALIKHEIALKSFAHLQDQQRLYYKLVQAFQKECERCEKIQRKLQNSG